MITLKINDIEVTVPRGSTILEAAEKARVFIPTLCHDKRITPYGACRLCVVEDRKKPGNLIPSCFTPARDRMDIVTETPGVLEAVRTQLQLILVNHPLECPVCDKAGECTLQDLVIRYNITEAPFGTDRFARYVDRQSPLIERDMTRCVLCGRCVRICGELQGRDELEFIHRGHKTVVATDGGRALDCDFCGLCVSTCPVGALNDKLFKDRARVWNLERRTTPCSHCGLGCWTDFHLEKGRLRRVTPAVLAGGKKGLICVRGQFGWRAFESPSRLSAPRLRRDGALRETGWGEAIEDTAKALDGIRRTHGASSLALLTADHLTTEEARACGALFRDTLGCADIGSLQAAGYRQILSVLDAELGPSWEPATLKDVSEAETLIVLGGGAAELHPTLKPLVNGLMRKEGRELVVLSSWPDTLTRRATLALTITAGYAEDFFAELRDALSAERTHASADIARFGVDTCGLARLISLLGADRKTTVLVAPDPFGDNLQRATACRAAPWPDKVDPPPRGPGQQCRRSPKGRPVFLRRRRRRSVADRGHRGRPHPGPLPPGRGPSRDPAGTGQGQGRPGEARTHRLPEPLRNGRDGSGPRGPSVGPDPGEGGHDPLDAGVRKRNPSRPSPLRAVPPGSGDPPGPRRGPRNGRRAPHHHAFGGAGADGVPPAQTVPEDAGHGFPFRLTAVPSLFGDGLLSRQSPDLAQIRRGLRIVMNGEDFEQMGLGEREIVEVRTPNGSARAEAGHDAAIPRNLLLLRHAAGSAAGLSLIRPGTDVVPAAIARIGT